MDYQRRGLLQPSSYLRVSSISIKSKTRLSKLHFIKRDCSVTLAPFVPSEDADVCSRVEEVTREESPCTNAVDAKYRISSKIVSASCQTWSLFFSASCQTRDSFLETTLCLRLLNFHGHVISYHCTKVNFRLRLFRERKPCHSSWSYLLSWS